MFPQIKDVHFREKAKELKSQFVFNNTKIESNILGVENLEYIALACQIFIDM
jgi:hypothetical protein